MPCIGIGGSVIAIAAVLSHRVEAGALRDRDGREATRSVLNAVLCIVAMVLSLYWNKSTACDWRSDAGGKLPALAKHWATLGTASFNLHHLYLLTTTNKSSGHGINYNTA